jgi:hypothetical protein
MTNANTWEMDLYEFAATSLEDLLAGTGLEWAREGEVFTARLAASRIVADPQQGQMMLRVEIVRLRNPSPESLTAMTDFLDALNSRLKGARAVMLRERALLTASIPDGALEAVEIERAVGALRVAASVTTRECAALLDPAVARHYLNFHK